MTPAEFIQKWRAAELKERTASQEHFLDLCELLGIEKPASADPKGEWFTFEKGASKTGGGEGWADVWRKECFAWEYKGKKKDLDRAFAQLQQYAIALDNPPLLIVSDMDRFRVHTNWTNTVQEVHEFALEDLLNGATRDLLRNCFEAPERLKPAKTRQMLTEEAAEEFSQLAQRLRSRGHEAHAVAHFVNRLVFCMFAEDVGLLPDHMFTAMLKASAPRPDTFATNAAILFGAMKSGGLVGFTKVEWFNGGLFDDDSTLPLERAVIDNLIAAAALDWSEIDPSILGTLFERGLDPDKRSQLGAHYTDREKIMQIVEPVIIRPLTAEWEAIRVEIEAQIHKAEEARNRTPTKQSEAKKVYAAARRAEANALKKAKELHGTFVDRLRSFRVLDPACGSGNFLYLSLLALKDLEHLVNLEAEQLGLGRFSPTVGPESVFGIELNSYAAELARVSVWIGVIQWMRRNGFEAARNPILRSLGNIECRDAILAPDGTEARWPDADAIVGNPPFLGAKLMKRMLGVSETERIRAAFEGRLPGFTDLVCYWFEKAREKIAEGRCERAGLVATNSIRKNTNLPVMKRILDATRIF
ncbi:MAG: DNA methyltransferase [Pseudomonadota bacterium]